MKTVKNDRKHVVEMYGHIVKGWDQERLLQHQFSEHNILLWFPFNVFVRHMKCVAVFSHIEFKAGFLIVS